jgi:mutator protein MutT
MERVDAAIAIVAKQGKILICQRKNDKALGGFWEFPGGKREPGESLEDCLRRELREELAIEVRPLRALTPIEHDYPHVHVRLHPFLCAHDSGQITHLECQTSRWIDPPALRDFRFPPANEPLLEEVIKYFETETDPRGT